jgi:F0F1-type ATP synthase membrane subunit b/b'
MDRSFIILTAIAVIYIIILVVYFLRRSKVHEDELKNFLEMAQRQLEEHKEAAEEEANLKVSKAINVVKKVQQAAEAFEEEAKTEYDSIIEEARAQRRDILAKAKAEIEELFKIADKELDTYKQERYQEVERNLVKLVIAISQKVADLTLTPKQHEDIILKALDEVKKETSKN